MDALKRLQDWYAAQCNGDWEHEYGVEIGTLDNPGWSLSIDLAGTLLEHAGFDNISTLSPESEWIDCRVEQGRFEGRCGPKMLEEMIMVFIRWADAVPHRRGHDK